MIKLTIQKKKKNHRRGDREREREREREQQRSKYQVQRSANGSSSQNKRSANRSVKACAQLPELWASETGTIHSHVMKYCSCFLYQLDHCCFFTFLGYVKKLYGQAVNNQVHYCSAQSILI